MIVAESFVFNGIHSDTVEVTKINISSGLVEEPFAATKSINTFSTPSSIKSHIIHTKREPLSFEMALFFDGNLNKEKEQEVRNWLVQEDYCEFFFEDNPNIIYYGIIDDDITIHHNSVDSGYITFKLLTNSPYRFSDYIVIDGKSTSNTSYTELDITVDGDFPSPPTIEIVSPSVTNLEIWNETTNKKCILNGTFTDLTVDILSEYEELDTRVTYPINLYSAHNGVFPILERGFNKLKFKGTFSFKLTYQNIYK